MRKCVHFLITADAAVFRINLITLMLNLSQHATLNKILMFQQAFPDIFAAVVSKCMFGANTTLLITKTTIIRAVKHTGGCIVFWCCFYISFLGPQSQWRNIEQFHNAVLAQSPQATTRKQKNIRKSLLEHLRFEFKQCILTVEMVCLLCSCADSHLT